MSTASRKPTPGAADRGLVEARWPATLAIVVAIGLYFTLPESLVLGPRWVLPALEGAILVPLTVARPHRHAGESGTKPDRRHRAHRAWPPPATLPRSALLVHLLLGGLHISGRNLIFSAIEIYLTNVIIFGLWYWELDGGGPSRASPTERRTGTSSFPQMNSPDKAPARLAPVLPRLPVRVTHQRHGVQPHRHACR